MSKLIATTCLAFVMTRPANAQLSIAQVDSYAAVPRIADGQVFDLIVRSRQPLPEGTAPGTWTESLNGVSVFARFFVGSAGVDLLIGSVIRSARLAGVDFYAIRCQYPFGQATAPSPTGIQPLFAATVSFGGNALDIAHFYTDFDSIQLETSCDGRPSSPQSNFGRMPLRTDVAAFCPVLFRHEDGTLVTEANPARVGERLRVRARGMGETTPPTASGQRFRQGLALRSITDDPTLLRATMDFGSNAAPRLAFEPEVAPIRDISAVPMADTIGWYLIEFTVPPVPEGKTVLPCEGRRVVSNATMNIHLRVSNGGGGFCLQPPAVPEEAVRP